MDVRDLAAIKEGGVAESAKPAKRARRAASENVPEAQVDADADANAAEEEPEAAEEEAIAARSSDDACGWHEAAMRLVEQWLAAREACDVDGAAACCAEGLLFRDLKGGVVVKTRTLAECRRDVFSKAAPKPTKFVAELAVSPKSTATTCVLAREFDFNVFFLSCRVRQEWRLERQQSDDEPRIVQVDVNGSRP